MASPGRAGFTYRYLATNDGKTAQGRAGKKKKEEISKKFRPTSTRLKTNFKRKNPKDLMYCITKKRKKDYVYLTINQGKTYRIQENRLIIPKLIKECPTIHQV